MTAVLVAATTSGAVASSAADSSAADQESTAERVLQSVSVEMSSDGTVTRVGGSVVETAGEATDAEVSESSYGPDEVVADLPVRVLTAYRTADGAGTDLSDLEGYTGRVAIDVTVQNLTVQPQVLSYDVDGTSRSQAALVGSPLTITASAALADLGPAQVVTDAEGTGANVTNGVLGRDSDGDTTVQWATMLAPPTLSSSAELSLVVDAKDFDVPVIDLSVQPGLVTDPSMGALIDSVFHPASSEEMQLQQRTIELIGAVNKVLARASGTITDVRSSLTSSAETLGTQTVTDLQASSQSVATSMRSLDGALGGLQQDLNASLRSTGSSALAELDQAVNAVDAMLGDTSARPPKPAVKGAGCDTSVAAPGKATNVYGGLLQVAGQLDGYSRATTECKSALRATILGTIGPEKPSGASCTRNGSVTCSLFSAEETFNDIADDLNALTDEAVSLLKPELYADADEALDTLGGTADSIEEITALLDTGRAGLLREIREALAGPLPTAGRALGTAGDAVADIAARATETKSDVASMTAQSQAAALQVCTLVADGTLTSEQADQIRGYLVSTPCQGGQPLPVPDKDGNGVPDFDSAMVTRLTELTDRLDDTIDDGARASRALTGLTGTLDRIAADFEEVLAYKYGRNPKTLEELGAELTGLFGVLDGQRKALDRAVSSLQDNYGQVVDIQQTIDDKVADAQEDIAADIASETRKVHDAGTAADEELGSMLERSSRGLSNAAGDVVRNGKETLSGQKRQFTQAQEAAGNRISREIEQGLSMISTGVTSSTRDMEAATTLLTNDLRKVLLDLGERRVGGGGLLGAMSTSAATARSADYQLALATGTTTSYANVRSRDIGGILLRQAQADAAMQLLADLPPFELELPSGSVHRTVYSYRIEGGQ